MSKLLVTGKKYKVRNVDTGGTWSSRWLGLEKGWSFASKEEQKAIAICRDESGNPIEAD